MRKLGNIILFFISCVICIYATDKMASIFDFHDYLEGMVEKEDCQQIYYSLGANDTDFNGITSFKPDNKTVEKIGDISGIKVQYPYTSIANTIDDDPAKAIVDVKVNGQKIEMDERSVIRIIPYYPEDNFDKEMKKVFISDSLWYQLDVNAKDEFKFPIDFEAVFYMPQFEAGENRTTITYQQQSLQFEVGGMLEDYYSTIHEEGYLLLVPYDLMEKLSNHQFESHIIFLEDVTQYQEVIEKMQEIEEDLVYYSGREYYEDFLDNIFTSYDLHEFFLNLVIAIAVIVFDFKYIFKFYPDHNRQGYLHWLIGFGIAVLVLYPSIYYRETLVIYAVLFTFVMAFVKKKKKY